MNLYILFYILLKIIKIKYKKIFFNIIKLKLNDRYNSRNKFLWREKTH